MKKGFIENNYQELLDIFNCMAVGIYITDNKGVTILVNDESCKRGGLSREEVMGRSMPDLVKEGFIEESISLKVLDSGESVTIVQNLGDGGKVLASGTPMYFDGELQYVITTERDITEVYILRELMEKIEIESEKYKKEIEYFKKQTQNNKPPLIAYDPKSKAVVNQIMRISKLDTTVLLTGESGVGKEVYANLIYESSARNDKPFIKVNCAAIAESLLESELFGYEKGSFTGAEKLGKAGYFEAANGGTIFLDEIAEFPLHLQSTLLRAIQEKEIIRIGANKAIPVDVRIIAATNTDLNKAVDEEKFRKDLFYRLSVMPIEIPSLRERKGDIAPLAIHFTNKFCEKHKIEKKIENSAIDELENYDWPGNIRELQNIIERSVISFDGYHINKFQVRKLLYPKNILGDSTLVSVNDEGLIEVLKKYEKELIIDALEKNKNASEAAKFLKISKSTMTRRMQAHNIKI